MPITVCEALRCSLSTSTGHLSTCPKDMNNVRSNTKVTSTDTHP